MTRLSFIFQQYRYCFCQTLSEPSMVLGLIKKGTLINNQEVYVLACHNTKATQPGGINIESKHDSVIVVAADTRLLNES